MDRRSFLKALGTTLAGCSIASIAEAAISSMPNASIGDAGNRVPSIKVIGMGRTGINLMQSIPIGLDALASHVQADYLSIRFNGRITRGIELPDMEWTIPLNHNHWCDVASDLHNVAFARQKMQGMERELAAYVKGADVVLLLIGLDNAMSFAACDPVARIARESGALTVALVGVPYGCQYEDTTDESLQIASYDAVHRILHEADCVITSNGIWASFQNESVTWDWYLLGDAPSTLLSAVWAASTTGDGFDRLRRVLSSSGKAVYAGGAGHSMREAVENAVDSLDLWFDTYDMATTATSGIVIVSGHPKFVNARLDEARIELAQIAPLKIPGGFNSEMLFLAEPDERAERYIHVSIISTGIEFAGEY